MLVKVGPNSIHMGFHSNIDCCVLADQNVHVPLQNLIDKGSFCSIYCVGKEKKRMQRKTAGITETTEVTPRVVVALWFAGAFLEETGDATTSCYSASDES